jgi:uncharacterized damage-inducible protein DinB
LDAILHEDLAGLAAARAAENDRIIGFAEALTEAQLASMISYRRISTPEPITQQLFPALMHLFNHQTHHRGQAHAILTGLGREAPVLDLLYFQRLHA